MLQEDFAEGVGEMLKWCENNLRTVAEFFEKLPLSTNQWRPLSSRKQQKPIEIIGDG